MSDVLTSVYPLCYFSLGIFIRWRSILQSKFDVIIVGAGPAGATLAGELARKGVSVAVMEKERLPRYKCCAGGLSVRATKLLNQDISDTVENEITGATFTFAGNRPYYRHDSRTIGYTVMRDKFDYALTERAEKAGAVVLQEHEVRRISMDDEGVQTFTAMDDFRSKYVVGADGAMSVVAKALDFKRKISYMAAIETEVTVAETVRQKWNSQVTIDLGRMPGYAWVFPKSDHLSIGIVCHRSRAKDLKRHYEGFLDSLHLGSHTVAKWHGALIPMCKGKMTAVRGRALLLGDAAGLADPLTGEGIYNAILSAHLAAPVIERSLQHNPGRLLEYQVALEKEMLPDLMIANFISSVFFRLPSISFRALNRDERIWRTGCAVLRGETNYVAIKSKLNALGGIHTFLSTK
ncbi:NAD(P)/FAD-dependent oxidoreductase [Chloroflexota bacterium]